MRPQPERNSNVTQGAEWVRKCDLIMRSTPCDDCQHFVEEELRTPPSFCWRLKRRTNYTQNFLMPVIRTILRRYHR
jgi:hypothetical protein